MLFDFVPILCGSAFKNKGVQPMLDAVIDFLPSFRSTSCRPRAPSPATTTRCWCARPARASVLGPRAQDRRRPVRQATYFRAYWARSTRVTRSTTPPRSARSASAASC
ncbi:MAG: hypothetical protein R2713_17205 [Ilumatobacteraceae bacterium]